MRGLEHATCRFGRFYYNTTKKKLVHRSNFFQKWVDFCLISGIKYVACAGVRAATCVYETLLSYSLGHTKCLKNTVYAGVRNRDLELWTPFVPSHWTI